MKPTRCSACFGKFLHNHVPQPVEDNGAVRWMHKSCAEGWRREKSLVWPATDRKPDRDE